MASSTVFRPAPRSRSARSAIAASLLQARGFTLSAIEKYVAAIPEDASAEEIAMQRTMQAPWMADRPVRLTRAELDSRAGRELTDDELTTLEEMEITLPCGDGTYEVALTQFSAQRTTTGQSTNAPGLLRLDMERVDGRWKLAELTPLTANR